MPLKAASKANVGWCGLPDSKALIGGSRRRELLVLRRLVGVGTSGGRGRRVGM